MASKKTPSKSSFEFPSDEATLYAQSVVSGAVIAGPHVRNACRRHLQDLQTGHERGLVWRVDKVERVLKFFRKILRLNGGDFEGKPFDPLPWQCFILGSVFGWYRLDDPTTRWASTLCSDTDGVAMYRRFTTAYQETGKGSGKSPLAAGIGLYMQIADGEQRAEVYAAATKKDQAMVLFRDAVAMVDQSAPLKSKVKKSGKAPNVWNLSYHQTNSFFRPIASDDGQSGPRPSCALLDEVHEHKTGHVIEMLRAGFKFRKQPLMFMITNSGADKTSVCYDYHEYGAKVSAGQIPDDTFFAYICAHDQGEDPFTDESCWPKSNPSLGHTFGPDYLRVQVQQARGMPSKESVVRRLHFCQWVAAHNPWLSSDVWDDNKQKPLPLNLLRGMTGHAGLDLSSKNDLTALVLTFEHDDGMVDVHPFFWVPEEGIDKKEEKDRVPYRAWANAGYIELVPGPVIDYAYVADRILQLLGDHELTIQFDRWRIDDLKRELARMGADWHDNEGPLQPHGQGFKDMNPAIEAAEDYLKQKKIRHGGHPVLTWCVSNAVVVKDPAELRKFDKSKATARIDGAVALAMALHSIRGVEQDESLDEFLSNPIVLG